jgi:hypothetical protein
MHIDVIEFELVCPEHGTQRTITPACAPRPHYCVHCFLPVTKRRAIRRYATEGPLPTAVGSEAWIG